jgi:hypothetical protein
VILPKTSTIKSETDDHIVMFASTNFQSLAETTASAKYSNEFLLPKDLSQVLRDLTREILRNQPKNIYEFGL